MKTFTFFTLCLSAWMGVAHAQAAAAPQATTPDQLDRVTRQFRCGPGLVDTCTQVSQSKRSTGGGFSVSVTEARSSAKKLLFIRQKLVFSVANLGRQIASVNIAEAPYSEEQGNYIYQVIAYGRPEDFRSNAPVTFGADLGQMGRMADRLHDEALRAQSESRQFVANQRVHLEDKTAIANQWNSAAVGGSTNAMLSIVGELLRHDDTSVVVGEMELDKALSEGQRDFLNVPDMFVEGAAVARYEKDFTGALTNGSFFDAAMAAQALSGAKGLSEGAARRLAAVTGQSGVMDFSKADMRVPASPLSSSAFLAYAGTADGRAVRFVANEYAAAWADYSGMSTLDAQDKFRMVAGLALLQGAANSGRNGDWRYRDAQLCLAHGLLDTVRGFGSGLAEGIVDTLKLIPEAAKMLSGAAQLLTASPEVQLRAVGRALKAIPEIPGAIRLSLAALYGEWQRGSTEERARLVGRLTTQVLIAYATGEVVPYLGGLAGASVQRTAAARGVLAQSLSTLDTAAIAEAMEIGAFEGGEQAAVKLTGLMRENPDAALELARIHQTVIQSGGDVSSFGTFVQNWDVLDAHAIRFAGDEIVSRGAVLDAKEMRSWATRYQDLRTKANTLVATAEEKTVIRAVPRYVEENGARIQLSPDDAFRASPNVQKSVGRFKQKDEFVWSTVVVDAQRGKPSAWQTAIAEYGEGRATEDFWIVEKTVSPNKVLVLDEPSLGKLNLSVGDITKRGTPDAYLDTHALARIARERGFEAIEAPSAAEPGGNWILHILSEDAFRP